MHKLIGEMYDQKQIFGSTTFEKQSKTYLFNTLPFIKMAYSLGKGILKEHI